ncbi:Heme oxygenase [Sphingomonas paucimobilis]|nr:Heme oxygenase [Sphingomonas paucimobilis]
MTTDILEPSRAKRLKASTHETHDRLDTSIMAAASFTSIAGYGRFVTVQYLFHRDIDALYDDAILQALLPGLTERRRLALITADLTDLGLPLPEDDTPLAFPQGDAVDIPAALGWLYVAEGSNMGAALLRKEAAKIGLSDEHGARHLAPAPEGPAAHWRAFTAALDALELTDDEEAHAVAGANAAFSRVQALVDARIG